MTGPANLIKAQIKANLNAITSVGGTLGAVIELDINTNVLEQDFPGYPCAILGTSNMQSEWEFPQGNRRTYRFDILVVQLEENLAGMGDMEDLRDAIAIRFDNNVTLAGTAQFGISAAFSEEVTYKGGPGRNLVIFNVTIKATTLVPLLYNF